MIKSRIIPILTFNGFALVKTKNFSNPRMLGNPIQSARIFNSRGVDELVFLDIMATKQNRKINLPIVKKVIDECFMPVSIGGGISSLDDIHDLLKIGADKIVIKTAAINNPKFILESSQVFGSQCITVSIDVIKNGDKYWVYNELNLHIDVVSFACEAQNFGAGEIILTSVDQDGKMQGFDIELYNLVSGNCSIPIVFAGGAGTPEHFQDLFTKTSCNSAGAASIFNFTQFTPLDVKNSLKRIGKPVRLN